MISGRRVQEFGLPRPQERPDVVRREIVISKTSGEPFGVKLMRYDDELYVARVMKNASASQISTSTGTTPTPSVEHVSTSSTTSPAFRAGLTFGDRIECIDDLTATILSTMDMRALYEYLACSSTVKLTVADRPLFSTYTLQSTTIEGHVGVGITYGKKQIVRIESHSIAHQAGMQKGQTIIEINGKCCLGMSDDKIRKKLEKLVKPAGQSSDNSTSSSQHSNVVLAMVHASAVKFQKALQGFINLDEQLKESVKQNLYAFDKAGNRMPQKLVKLYDYVDDTLSLYRPATAASSVQKTVTQPKRLINASVKGKNKLLKTVMSSNK
jgi:hypothetical protein